MSSSLGRWTRTTLRRGGAACLVLLAVDGCGTTGPDGTGALNVLVAASPGVVVSGAEVELWKEDDPSVREAGRTGGGPLIFRSLEPGAWRVRIDLPGGYVLDGSERVERTVEIRADHATELSLVVEEVGSSAHRSERARGLRTS